MVIENEDSKRRSCLCLTNIWMDTDHECKRKFLPFSMINYRSIQEAYSSFSNGELLLGGLLFRDTHSSLISSGNVVRLLGHMELHMAV